MKFLLKILSRKYKGIPLIRYFQYGLTGFITILSILGITPTNKWLICLLKPLGGIGPFLIWGTFIAFYSIISVALFKYENMIMGTELNFNPDDVLWQVYTIDLELNDTCKMTYYTIYYSKDNTKHVKISAQATTNYDMRISKGLFDDWPISHIQQSLNKEDCLFFVLNNTDNDYNEQLSNKLGYSIDFIKENEICSQTWFAKVFRQQSKEIGVLVIESTETSFQYLSSAEENSVTVSSEQEAKNLSSLLEDNAILQLFKDTSK